MTTRKKKTTKKAEQMELGGDAPEHSVTLPGTIPMVHDDGAVTDMTVTEHPDGSVSLQEGPRAHPAVIDFAALATNPDVDVDKLERLIAMSERAGKHAAEAAFTGAFAIMQGDLPEITKHGKNKSLGSSYAKFEHIQRAIRPVMQAHGFALSFFVNSGDVMNITARLSHAAGHYEETTVNVGDPSELTNKGVNKVQAKGSAISYAKRYGTCALLNIVTVDEDDDGAGSEAPEPPEGYADWLLELDAIASEQGTEALREFWKDPAGKGNRQYLATHRLGTWHKLQATAAATTKGGA